MTEAKFEWIVSARPAAKHAGPYVDLLDDYAAARTHHLWPTGASGKRARRDS